MDAMVTDDVPSNGAAVFELSDPPPPGTTVNTGPTSILQELSKFEPFDETTCSWPDFAERVQELFEFYDVPSEKRVRIFIDRISNATYEKLRGLCKPVPPLDKSLDELWQIMDRYFNRYWNVYRERVKFIRRVQRAHENILKYATELKRWSKNCRFPEPWGEEALITQFMNGVRSDELQKQLVRREEDDFDQLVDFACNVEAMEATLKATADEVAAVDVAIATCSTDATTGSTEAQTNATEGSSEAQTNAMEVDESSDAIVCYSCFEPGHKSPACKLKKRKRVKKNKTDAISHQKTPKSKNQNTHQIQSEPTNRNKITPTNKSNITPANKNQAKNPSKNQWANKNKKQGANQFKFQNNNQFKNQYRSQFAKPLLSYSNQPGGQFDDFKNVLRNQYKDLHRHEYNSSSYSNRTLSSTYQPNSSLFNR